VHAVEKAQYFYSARFFLTVSHETLMLVAKHAATTRKVCKSKRLCFNL
jgi:antirestriction protein ArdC